ncbi:hypothetical protein N7481_006399 [Penicillium waksmanii]|uniref:uncharacterized protein n=1 Tax=Penicillium waksmanii TaxID=69791 RepID=UPI0025465ED0|nr:uncharacterized protein N7481_006399 [Penicillium waksmanii]KAJ5984300.1 hypothetical protein N7481_006399 [Penicillium waksmanii]
MSRPTTSLKQWLHLRQTLSAQIPSTISPRARNLAVSAVNASRSTTSSSDAVTVTSTRSFHSTRARQAAAPRPRKAPGTMVRRRQAERDGQMEQRIGVNGQLFLKSSVQNRTKKSMGECLELHEKVAGTLYDAAVADGELPREISFKTYNDIGVKLITAAFENEVSAAAVRAISVDVDAVFRIGHIVALPLEEPMIAEWILSSCARAKARLPLVIVVNRAISGQNVVPARTQWTDDIEELARTEYPPAMLLHAQIQGRRGKYESAFRQFENRILPRVSPTRKRPNMFSSIQIGDKLDSPYRTYALLRAAHDQQFDSAESRQKADEAIRIAAMEFNDPEALTEYASVMMNEGNLDMYEEYMCKAATAGHGIASFYLGNFYYLTFLGKYKTRGERESNQNRWPPAWMARLTGLNDPAKSSSPVNKSMKYIASFLNRSMPQKAYHQLASNWYDVALAQGYRPACFMVALLGREVAQSEAELEDAGIFFEMARLDENEELKKTIAELEKNWFNRDFEPTVPKKFMAVR